jgi:uncharacterized protein HemY
MGMGYDLNEDHRVRYFYDEANLRKLLKNIRRFLKHNPDVEVTNLDITIRCDYDDKARIIHEATLIYYGGSNA